LKKLFKYLAEPRDLFESGFIRLTQPSALNDPFEANFCHNSLDELASHFKQYYVTDVGFDEDTSFSEYIKKEIDHIGIVSFSENKENLLMWAHYANEHKGIVAGISYREDVEESNLFENLVDDLHLSTAFPSTHSPFDGKPRPVMYRKGLRYRNDKFDYDYSNLSVEGADRFLFEVFLQKSDEWIYEQEHRVILRLEQADRVILPSIEEIENQTFRNHIGNLDCSFVDPKKGLYIIDLMKITDENERAAYAMGLAKLSHNPKVVYLMKLSSTAINNCLIGLNSIISKEEILGKHATANGYIKVWKAKKNQDQYSLEFEQI